MSRTLTVFDNAERYGLTADEAWREWLRQCRAAYLAYGGDLVEMLGIPDNVRIAETLLKQAVTDGYLERGKNPTLDRPSTRALAFFGVGGSPGVTSDSLVLYGFSPTDRLWFGAMKKGTPP